MPVLPDRPTLDDFQAYVRKLEEERGFTKFDVLRQCLLLGEEVGELFKAIRKSEAGMGYATKGYEANPADELADIFIMLCAIASRLNINLEEAFKEKEIRNHQRTWK